MPNRRVGELGQAMNVIELDRFKVPTVDRDCSAGRCGCEIPGLPEPTPLSEEFKMRNLRFAILVLSLLQAGGLFAQSEWTRFRGPNGSGVSAEDKPLPTRFGKQTHLQWRAPLAPGHSSPVLWGDRVFLTVQQEKKLETVCLDRRTGEILWRQAAPAVEFERVHRVNSLASSSPTVDGKRVYVYFGSYGLLSYDFEGNEIWRRPFRQKLRNSFGVASSLMLAGDLLIFACDNNTESFLEAIQPATGKIVWRREREGFKSSWSTPVLRNVNGVDELVVYGVWWLSGLDLKDGSQRWTVPGLADEPAVTPVLGDGLVYVSSYNMKTNTEVIGLPTFDQLLKEYDADGDGRISYEEGKANKSVLSRFDADGEGDHPLRIFYRMMDADRDEQITQSEYSRLTSWVDGFQQENGLVAIRPPAAAGEKAQVAWRYRKGVPEIPSPLFLDGRLYMVKNGGILTCLDGRSGELVFQERIGAGGPYYASPVYGDGKIYLTSARGVVSVVRPGDKLDILAQNKLGERVMATPAISQGLLLVRTEKALYAFQ